ncbi:hypothetical protein [Fodinibius sediminis]|uniref:Restriction endonuclease n=1 Tax=Fodinibius sediminis TaxID=1214077 RepID=A0A521FEI2_9BACT|nr:hypothetical protein [Fodinibius sediminis]SMO94583.1 hypothetical protein SAMN06265218_1326 [Fodinibius sediminis]
MIKVEEVDGEIVDIHVNGESIKTADLEVWYLPKKLIGDSKVENLPIGTRFEFCRNIRNGVIEIDSIPTIIERIAGNKVQVVFSELITRKYWDGKIGLKEYMTTKKSVIEDRAKEAGDIELLTYHDDGVYIQLEYATELEDEKLIQVAQMAEQISEEIEGATEIIAGRNIWNPEDSENEKEFTLRTVIPIIRKIGFNSVKYNHGKREYGRDILFNRITEFQEIEFWAAQVKFGDISGSAGGDIDEIIAQIDDAFKMPFYDVYTKQKNRISKLAIIISGKFTNNAIEKICEKIEKHSTRNNLVFIDGEKIRSLSDQYLKLA